jgi:hypothetical protein
MSAIGLARAFSISNIPAPDWRRCVWLWAALNCYEVDGRRAPAPASAGIYLLPGVFGYRALADSGPVQKALCETIYGLGISATAYLAIMLAPLGGPGRGPGDGPTGVAYVIARHSSLVCQLSELFTVLHNFQGY